MLWVVLKIGHIHSSTSALFTLHSSVHYKRLMSFFLKAIIHFSSRTCNENIILWRYLWATSNNIIQKKCNAAIDVQTYSVSATGLTKQVQSNTESAIELECLTSASIQTMASSEPHYRESFLQIALSPGFNRVPLNSGTHWSLLQYEELDMERILAWFQPRMKFLIEHRPTNAEEGNHVDKIRVLQLHVCKRAHSRRQKSLIRDNPELFKAFRELSIKTWTSSKDPTLIQLD